MSNETPATIVRCGAGLIGSTGSGVIKYTDVGIAGREAAAIEYDILWTGDMQWVRNGKLPGIYGGGIHPFNPSRIPSGLDGFTVRPMWTTGGGAVLYLWDMKAGPYGRGPSVKGIFKAGKRQLVRLAVTMNTPGKDDGVVNLDVDGKRVLSVADLKARTTSAMKLTGCFWCVFYGGATPDYAPTTDQHITVSQVKSV